MGSPSVYCKWQTDEQQRMGSTLPCRHLLTGRSWGRCKHSGASSGDNLWLVSYSMIPSNLCKCDEASLPVEEEQAASPPHLLCTIYWGCCLLRLATSVADQYHTVQQQKDLGRCTATRSNAGQLCLQKQVPHGSTRHFRTSLHSVREHMQTYSHYLWATWPGYWSQGESAFSC